MDTSKGPSRRGARRHRAPHGLPDGWPCAGSWTGEVGSFSVDGGAAPLSPGVAVWFMKGAAEGVGPCPAYLSGGCWDISSPRFIQVAWTDGGGVATWDAALSAGLVPGTNAAEGNGEGWHVDHHDDGLNTYVPGAGSGEVVVAPAGFAYPKHVASFNGEVLVTNRNDCRVHRYDFAGTPLGSFSAGCTSGQGLATDGASLFVGVWSGTSSIQEYDAAFGLITTHGLPSGMAGDNLVDFAFHPTTGTWFGMDAVGEGGTGTRTSTLIEFTMGGSVLSSTPMGYEFDGVGINACE
jgi:hypothetical protein